MSALLPSIQPLCTVPPTDVEHRILQGFQQRLAHLELRLAPIVAAACEAQEESRQRAAVATSPDPRHHREGAESSVLSRRNGKREAGGGGGGSSAKPEDDDVRSDGEDSTGVAALLEQEAEAKKWLLLRQIEAHLTVLEKEHGIHIRPRGPRACFGAGSPSPSTPPTASPTPPLDRSEEQFLAALELSGWMELPVPGDPVESQRVWEEQLGVLEALQQEHGERLANFIPTCERVLQQCERLCGSEGSTSASGSSAAPLLSAETLRSWLTCNPTYAFEASLTEAERRGRSGPQLEVRLREKQREAAAWERAAAVTGNALDSGAPRGWNDAYVLALENQQRYRTARERWAYLKHMYLRSVQYANELLCDVTLELDQAEDEQLEGSSVRRRTTL